ncbi:hypothetical protein [Sphingomonas sp.]|jgi:hypothetical protein|uniref:hypothetical protein n=1 Tax=Sphingomonas sp. TaxID=28214 RepID=UPI002E3186C0|nr:hypothetical protein [Sphingomonas sp.]HEX4693463.1 hypothetical protein [Sphingomonas sp.]
MDPTPYFIMGSLFGITATLAIQWFANRKATKAVRIAQSALAAPTAETLLQQRERAEMARRLAALEEIVTDQPKRLAFEIDSLR